MYWKTDVRTGRRIERAVAVMIGITWGFTIGKAILVIGGWEAIP